MSILSKRGFLKAFGGGVVAAPVMARQAAAQIATAGAAVSSSKGTSILGASSYGIDIARTEPDVSGRWVAKHLKEIFSPEFERRLRREAASEPIAALDPDLASSRSLSLSAAMRIQRERMIARRLDDERQTWLDSFKRETGFDWVPDFEFASFVKMKGG